MTDQGAAVVWAADYLPFGTADVSVGSVDNNLRFAGQYYDNETGLHYNWNRYYDPSLGRYLRYDPIGLDGGINPYIYVDNNPINIFDPNGLKKCVLLWSLPIDWDYSVREKWTDEGKWGLASVYTEGGWGRGRHGLPWVTAVCRCTKTMTGKRRTEFKILWNDHYFCIHKCEETRENRKRWETVYKKTEKAYKTQTKLLSGGIYANETLAAQGCSTICQNLNFIK
jgi:RHS repeat-associated protein